MIIEDKRVGDIVGRVVKVIESLVDFSIVSGFIKDRNSLEIVFINQEGEIFLLDLWRIQKLFQYKFIVVIFLRENLQVVVYFQINILVQNIKFVLLYFEISLYVIFVVEN